MKIHWKFRTTSESTIISINEIQKINEIIMSMTIDDLEKYNKQMMGFIKEENINKYIGKAITIEEK
jgi:hypothetical protein